MNARYLLLTILMLLSGLAFNPSAQAQGFGYGNHHGPYRHLAPYRWHEGYWHHGYYRGNMGWWWVNGGSWYYYNAPVYPYPTYQPNTIIVEQPPVAVQPTPVPPPPAVVITTHETASDGIHEMNGKPASANYYYCQSPAGYYPTVSACPGGWAVTPASPVN